MTEYDEAVTAIVRAVHLGVSCDELPYMTSDEIKRIARWLASEGIGRLDRAPDRDVSTGTPWDDPRLSILP